MSGPKEVPRSRLAAKAAAIIARPTPFNREPLAGGALGSVSAIAAPGTVLFERFEVISHTVGGQAIVYRCKDKETGGHVALKHLEFGVAARFPEKLKMLKREAEILAAFEHQSKPRFVSSRFESHIQGYYVAYEWANGVSLKDAVEQKLIPFIDESITHIATYLLDILEALHARKYSHCDVSPGNVILDFREGEIRGVKLIDFGAAAINGERIQGDATKTSLMATEGFAAPEVIFGQSPSAQSDFFSIGALLLLLKTGLKTNDPSVFNLANYTIPDSSGVFREILANTLSVIPTSRYQNVNVFKQDLHSALVPKPVNVPQIPPGFRVSVMPEYENLEIPAIITAVASTVGLGFGFAYFLQAKGWIPESWFWPSAILGFFGGGWISAKVVIGGYESHFPPVKWLLRKIIRNPLADRVRKLPRKLHKAGKLEDFNHLIRAATPAELEIAIRNGALHDQFPAVIGSVISRALNQRVPLAAILEACRNYPSYQREFVSYLNTDNLLTFAGIMDRLDPQVQRAVASSSNTPVISHNFLMRGKFTDPEAQLTLVRCVHGLDQIERISITERLGLVGNLYLARNQLRLSTKARELVENLEFFRSLAAKDPGILLFLREDLAALFRQQKK